eukprot:CAMPEP_0179337876 /NCGR_PEP_ID=MMETSP0797-20121207/67874_1 /TAXON_ID=47934 /ORGANISM="Dinophysis acuminata, Strain DAEP01" /LENGTH=394 /DNA_ID=CAMNT_0021051587 /DNA_START=69 /DNA_END=1250 /DNA_ORIENTATION=+
MRTCDFCECPRRAGPPTEAPRPLFWRAPGCLDGLATAGIVEPEAGGVGPVAGMSCPAFVSRVPRGSPGVPGVGSNGGRLQARPRRDRRPGTQLPGSAALAGVRGGPPAEAPPPEVAHGEADGALGAQLEAVVVDELVPARQGAQVERRGAEVLVHQRVPVVHGQGEPAGAGVLEALELELLVPGGAASGVLLGRRPLGRRHVLACAVRDPEIHVRVGLAHPEVIPVPDALHAPHPDAQGVRGSRAVPPAAPGRQGEAKVGLPDVPVDPDVPELLAALRVRERAEIDPRLPQGVVPGEVVLVQDVEVQRVRGGRVQPGEGEGLVPLGILPPAVDDLRLLGADDVGGVVVVIHDSDPAVRVRLAREDPIRISQVLGALDRHYEGICHWTEDQSGVG